MFVQGSKMPRSQNQRELVNTYADMAVAERQLIASAKCHKKFFEDELDRLNKAKPV